MKNVFKNKKIMIVVAVLVVLVFVFFFIKRRKEKDNENDKSVSDGAASYVASDLPVASYPLQPYSMVGEYSTSKGSYGKQIAELQQLCNKKYGTSLDVDGKYGPKTDEVFRKCLGTLLFSCKISESQYKIFMNQ